MRRVFIPVFLMFFVLTGCTPVRGDSDIIIAGEGFSEDEAQGVQVEDDERIEIYDNGTENSASAEASVPSDIVVYVCGAVVSPGVYELPAGCRVNDALVAAGGFSDEADKNYINLAATISDGIKLMVPTKEEVAKAGGSMPEPSLAGDTGIAVIHESSEESLININTATAEELRTLPGIGDAVSGKIVDYRQKNGNFKRIEDIMKVSGIKDKLFAKIKDKITV